MRHLNAEMLSRILGQTVDVEIEPLNTGHISDVARVHIRPNAIHSKPVPGTLIYKAAPSGVSSSIENAFASQARERSFYLEIAPNLSIPTPKLWYASPVTDPRKWLLIEDVQPIEGLSLTEDQALNRLGEIHRHTVGRPITKILFANNISVLYQQINLIPTEKINRLLEHSASVSPKLAAHMMHALQQKLVPETTANKALIHCDYRWDNLSPARDGTVFDWGDYCFGPISFDLSYFVMTSMGHLHPKDNLGWQRLFDAYSGKQQAETASLTLGIESEALKLEVKQLAALVAWTPTLLLLSNLALSPTQTLYWQKTLQTCSTWFAS